MILAQNEQHRVKHAQYTYQSSGSSDDMGPLRGRRGWHDERHLKRKRIPRARPSRGFKGPQLQPSDGVGRRPVIACSRDDVIRHGDRRLDALGRADRAKEVGEE